MFNIAAGLPRVPQQTRRGDATDETLAPRPHPADAPPAFDIGTTPAGVNTAWLATGDALHRLDLERGAISGSCAVAGLPGSMRDLTIVAAE